MAMNGVSAASLNIKAIKSNTSRSKMSHLNKFYFERFLFLQTEKHWTTNTWADFGQGKNNKCVQMEMYPLYVYTMYVTLKECDSSEKKNPSKRYMSESLWRFGP